jgi:hypothetical protein
MSGGAHQSDAMAYEWLKSRGYAIFQADWIATAPDGDCFVVEAKYQERFTPPPFAGHGLPPHQVEARLAFQAAYGIRTLLLIFDKQTGEIFYEWLDVLDAGPQHQTNGNHPRRIYPLESFRQGRGQTQLHNA